MTYNFPTHVSGDTFLGVDFQLVINGVEKSLSGAKIIMRVGVKEFSSGRGEIAIINEAQGRFRFIEQVINLRPMTYRYKMVFIFPGGRRKSYLTGIWTITD